MYSISDDSSRRAGHFPGHRELPVLFHLMDVSRPRPPAKFDEPAIESDEPTLAPIVPPMAEPSPSPIAEQPFPSAPSAAASHSILADDIVADDSPAPAFSSGMELPPAAIEPSSAASDGQSVLSEQVASAEPEKPAPQPTVTPRSQTHSRRKPKTAASEDWFAAHGKFIAAAFVLALIGTIYFARTSRQQTPTTSDVAKDATAANDSSSRTPIASGEGPAANTAPLINTVSATTESKAELHAPTTPASGLSADDKSPAKDDLFVFKTGKTGDERVAASPAKAATAAPPLVTAPAAAGSPAMAPAYPTTNASPPPAYPVAPTPANSYPQTAAPPIASPAAPPNYQSQYPLPAASPPTQQQAWSPPAPGANLPSQYQPVDSTARGPRYERTGSGNY